MRHKLVEAMQAAILALRKWPGQTVHIFHHNDADGLSCGAILLKAFEREGLRVKRFCLEKPYPRLLDRIYEMKGQVLVFADFAGRIAPMLSGLNRGRNLTLILDHHVAAASTDPNVHNLDPDLYGLKGDRDISGSTTCYLFAQALNPTNCDMAHIAVIGAVGDGFFTGGRLVSQNRTVMMEAARQGLLEIETNQSGERYILKSKAGEIPCDEFAVDLELWGAVGYFQGGPDMGVRVCLEGKTPEADKMADDLRKIKARAFRSEIARLEKSGPRQTPHIQ